MTSSAPHRENPVQESRHEALLKVTEIAVFYGSLQALWNISLTVRSGEIVALIGSNGSGKSTLLDTLSGVIHPAEGTIEFSGKRITNLEPFEIVSLGVTQVPEGRQLFPELSVLDNLIMGSYSGHARSKKEQNLEVVYEHFPILEERKHQLAKALSGGEQQMLAIGRGLMSDPRLMLLDEMSLGLAPIILDKLYQALKEIRQRGITILFVEQNVRRSLNEADRAYIIERGRVVLEGPTVELREEETVKRAYFGL
jgi:branched-chain amino acid transport system ATP-binding protein